MDNSISAKSLLSSIGDVNQWTVAHFFVELYTSANSDNAKSVNVDLVQWLNHNGNKKYTSGADKVTFYDFFDLIIFIRIFRINNSFMLICSNTSNKCIALC
jgi:hypothetical protein